MWRRKFIFPNAQRKKKKGASWQMCATRRDTIVPGAVTAPHPLVRESRAVVDFKASSHFLPTMQAGFSHIPETVTGQLIERATSVVGEAFIGLLDLGAQHRPMQHGQIKQLAKSHKEVLCPTEKNEPLNLPSRLRPDRFLLHRQLDGVVGIEFALGSMPPDQRLA